MANKQTPEVRFEGFSGDWEEKKLGEFTKLITKGTTPKEKSENGEVNFIKVENISNGKIKPKMKIDLEVHEGYLRRSKLKENDILFSIAGTLGRTAIVKEKLLPANTNQALAIIRGYDFETDFLITVLSGRIVAEYIRKNPTVGAQPNLSLEQVKKLDIYSPSIEEQTRIGSFFKQLDDTIAIEQQQLDALKQSKQGFLQKMFPKEGATVPEVRFEGFSGDWELKPLKDVADYRNGKAHEKNISETGSYIVINSKFVSTNGQVKKYSDMQIEPLNTNEIAFVLSDVPNGRAIARTFLVDEDNKYSLNQRIAGITPHLYTDAYFLSVLLNRNNYFLRFDDGVGQTNLSKFNVELFLTRYPNKEEQTRIGSFFKQLDDAITLQQRELDALKETKKAFLQKLFI